MYILIGRCVNIYIQEIENGGPTSRKINVAALRPIPHTRRHKMIPFSGYSEIGRFDGDHTKGSLPMPPKHGASGGTPVTHRKAFSGSYQRKQIISLNPLPLKKHDCGRAHIQICSEVCIIFLGMNSLNLKTPFSLGLIRMLSLYVGGVFEGCDAVFADTRTYPACSSRGASRVSRRCSQLKTA